MAVSFDLFGTLVRIEGPDAPAAAVGEALDRRAITVPEDWATAYRERHVDVPQERELALSTHVSAALESRGVTAHEQVVERAVREAFEPTVETVPGASNAVETAAAAGPVCVCSNCAVPGLAQRALDCSALDIGRFEAVVTSVDVGWRKPAERIFEAAADAVGCAVSDLIHVGDDPATDGGLDELGGRSVIVETGEFAGLRRLVEGST